MHNSSNAAHGQPAGLVRYMPGSRASLSDGTLVEVVVQRGNTVWVRPNTASADAACRTVRADQLRGGTFVR